MERNLTSKEDLKATIEKMWTHEKSCPIEDIKAVYEQNMVQRRFKPCPMGLPKDACDTCKRVLTINCPGF